MKAKTMNTEQDIDKSEKALRIGSVRRCSFFVIIRVFDKYFKTKVYAENIEDVEQIIKKTIIECEYQIMNIYKANE